MIEHLGNAWTLAVLAWFVFIFFPRVVDENARIGAGDALLSTPIITAGVYVDTTEFEPEPEVAA